MKYICAKYKLPDHWYPIDINKRAKIDEYLSWHHTNTRPASIDITWGKVRKLNFVCWTIAIDYFSAWQIFI